MREPIVIYKYKKCTACDSGYVTFMENGLCDMIECSICDGESELFVVDEVLDGDKDYEDEYVEE